ncbi:glycosyltransferase [Corallibacter sp.]|uniref:glycosyltransferase n=1 Tax=Corallibacter sp. TaxID=2038084 RepID=UPI003A8F8AC4
MKRRILVAPLNWGLGHATRCIPIIHALITNNFEPIIASDGAALNLLKKEFPNLLHLELPSYNITYSKKGAYFKLKLLKDSPKMLTTLKAEKKAVKKIIEDYDISGIISDNRFGVSSKHIPSVFITHQLQVLSGNTTWFSSKMHQKIIKKFDECWVPDNVGEPNLSGKLGHIDIPKLKVKHIGPLSRLQKTQNSKTTYSAMVLLSGPEPQRTLLEEKLLESFKTYKGSVLFVRGVIEGEPLSKTQDHITVYNYMTSQMLEEAINSSAFIISRSGYTTVMDLAQLGKKAFFIPTPGQFEQEYLAERLTKTGLVPSCKQSEFSIDKLKEIDNYKGLSGFDYEINYKKLFNLFKTE